MNDFSARIAALSPEQRSALEQRLRQEMANRASAITPRAATESPVLSSAQERLWVLHQLHPDVPLYNESILLRLSGSLNHAALEQSLQTIIQRHEILRTSFPVVEGQPVAAIAPHISLHLPIIDLQFLPVSQQSVELHRRIAEVSEQPFNLDHSPLLRGVIFQLQQQEHVLLLTLHHIISDGGSRAILFQELASLYQSKCQRLAATLPELPIQYTDFAWWQQKQSNARSHHLEYWKQQLQDAPLELNLPTDQPRSVVPSFQGAQQEIRISKSLTQSLRSLSQQNGVTLFMLLLAAFKVLLHRYTGQTDLVVGTPVTSRTQIQTEPLIGCFINTLVLRTRLSGDSPFQEVLAQVRDVTLAAQTHAIPFEQLVQTLQPERSLSQNPLFQVMFVFQESAPSVFNLPNLTIEPMTVESRIARFDLMLSWVDAGEELIGTIQYSTDRFKAPTIAQVGEHLQQLLERIAAEPTQRLSELNILTPQDQQFLYQWNQTQAEIPEPSLLLPWIEAQVEKSPDAIALVFQDQQLTYRELNQRANQLAHELRSREVGPDVLVGLCLERSLEIVIALLGVLKAGGAYVPLDPSYPTERLAFMLQDAQVSVLLTQSHLQDRLPFAGQVIDLDRDWGAIAQNSTTNPICQTHPDDLIYVIYTSGSTGRPKGAMNNHRALANRLHWMQTTYHLTSNDIVLQKTPFSFDVSVWEFFWSLISGAKLVLAAPEGHRDSGYLVRLIQAQQVSTLHFVPSMLRPFLIEPQMEQCLSLKRILCSGEALPLDLAKQVFERLQNTELHNLYGPTEAAIDVTAWRCQPQDESVPIGKAIANIDLYILDAQGQQVPIGVPGELHIGGIGLARGYLKRPDLTAEKFVPHPFSIQPGARLYKTGDLARYRWDGAIEYLGRIDFQVKLRGLRIELGEIESLLQQHPQVKQAVVTVQEVQPGDQRLVAYIVPDPDSDIALGLDSQLRDSLKQTVPEYMVPTVWVRLEELPLSANGKLDRKGLPVPDVQLATNKGFVAPRTPIESSLVALWGQILGVQPVGIHDNFFELGGHSLLATQIISQLRQMFQVELPLRSLFEAPTIATLAATIQALIQAERGLDTPPIQRSDRTDQFPLSFAQQRIWFLSQLEPDSPFYNIPTVLYLTGTLNLSALQQSIATILNRHAVLRTTIQQLEGQAIAVITLGTKIDISIVDLSDLSEHQQKESVQHLIQTEAHQPFSLDRDCLLRVKLLRLNSSDSILLATMHHLAADGWSMGVLVRELTALYRAYVTETEAIALPELPIQYGDFAVWQRQWLQGHGLAAQLDYWKTQLADAPTVLELPTDFPRPAVQTFNGASYAFQLPSDLSQSLTTLSQKQGVTLFMLLLAAFNVLLGRYCDSDDVLVGSAIANRNRAEVENLIGCFINTLVLRTDLSGNPSFSELLQRVRQMTLDAYAHQDLPFEQLVDALQPERSLSHSPIFQVMLVLHNMPTETLELPRLTVKVTDQTTQTAKFDLTLSFLESPSGLSGVLEYNKDLFVSSTIERIAAQLQVLLAGIVANPDQRLSELPLLTDSEYQRLHQRQGLQMEVPPYCLHQCFETQVQQTPDAIAVVFDDVQLTYQELNQRANQLAHELQSLGAEPEQLICLCLPRSLEMMIALLAILKTGSAYVPLDPTYPAERLGYMLTDAQVSILVTVRSQLPNLSLSTATVICLDADAPRISQRPITNPTCSISPDHRAYVIYTSGSTGKPKGVEICHRAVVSFLYSMLQRPGLTPQDVLLSVTTLSFDIAALEIFLPLITGARLAIAAQDTVLDGHSLARRLTEVGGTVIQATPATWQLLLKTGWLPQPHLKVLCGGEALPRTLANQLLAIHATLWNLYGPTETTIWSAADPVDIAEGSVPIGSPIANTEFYVLDRYLQPVPLGVPGELHIGGLGLARGYLNRPDLTAERFIPNPFCQGSDRLYKTGDWVRHRPDDTLEFLGRGDRQVKLRGFRLEIGEIEAVLNRYPGVQQAVVMVREDTPGDRALVAYVIPEKETEIDRSALRQFLRQHLPEYMVPSQFSVLAQFPLTPNGKVNRRALPRPSALGTPAISAHTPPRTELERSIAAIWKRVLQVEDFSVEDSFFDVGGHSLRLVEVHNQLSQQLSVNVSLLELFRYPTISSLAAFLSQSQDVHQPLESPPERTEQLQHGKARLQQFLHRRQSRSQ